MQYRTVNPSEVRRAVHPRNPNAGRAQRVIEEYDQIMALGHRAEILFAEFHGYRVVDRTVNP